MPHYSALLGGIEFDTSLVRSMRISRLCRLSSGNRGQTEFTIFFVLGIYCTYFSMFENTRMHMHMHYVCMHVISEAWHITLTSVGWGGGRFAACYVFIHISTDWKFGI